MSELAIPRTQYNDLKGALAADGHEGPFLLELAKAAGLPETYFPISLNLFTGTALTDEFIQIYLLAVEKDAMNAAGSLVKYAAQHDPLPVSRFRINLRASELLHYFKRLDVNLTLPVVADTTMKILDNS